jgi:hypothetical protein
MVPIGVVYSIHAPTEVAIKEMIEASQRMSMLGTTQNTQYFYLITQVSQVLHTQMLYPDKAYSQ